MEVMAEAHGLLSQKIESDVERPLKDFGTKNREMQSMSTIQGNLSSLAKDVDAAQKKAAKLSGGKTSAAKVANATSDVDAANQQWESQAPYVFEQLQALDESRINHLRDVLTQLETHEADQVERNRTSAENCLNAILNVNTADEISAFVAKQTANAPPIPETQIGRHRTNSNIGASPPPSELPAPAATPARKKPEDVEEPSPFSTASKTGVLLLVRCTHFPWLMKLQARRRPRRRLSEASDVLEPSSGQKKVLGVQTAHLRPRNAPELGAILFEGGNHQNTTCISSSLHPKVLRRTYLRDLRNWMILLYNHLL